MKLNQNNMMRIIAIIIMFTLTMCNRPQAEDLTSKPELEKIPVPVAESGLFSHRWEEAAMWYKKSPFELTYREYHWYYSIKNPDNFDRILVIGWDLGISSDSVTQEQFNKKYLN